MFVTIFDNLFFWIVDLSDRRGKLTHMFAIFIHWSDVELEVDSVIEKGGAAASFLHMYEHCYRYM